MYYAYSSLFVVILRRNAKKEPGWDKLLADRIEILKGRNAAVYSDTDGVIRHDI